MTSPASTVVTSTLSSSRGRAGALSTLPGCGCSSGAAPNGSAMKKTSHQTITKVTMAPEQRHACSSSTSVPLKSLGCRNSTGLPCAPILGSPSPSTRAPCGLQAVAGGQDVVDLVADVMDAARRVLVEEALDRRGLAEHAQQLDLGVRQLDEHRLHAVLGLVLDRPRRWRPARRGTAAPRPRCRARRWRRGSGGRSWHGLLSGSSAARVSALSRVIWTSTIGRRCRGRSSAWRTAPRDRLADPLVVASRRSSLRSSTASVIASRGAPRSSPNRSSSNAPRAVSCGGASTLP